MKLLFKMMLKFFFLTSFFFLLNQQVHAVFRGRLPVVDEEDKWVYAENASNRKIAFVSMDVVGEEQQGFEGFGLDLARTLASQMDGFTRFEAKKNDFKPIFRNSSYYKRVVFSLDAVQRDVAGEVNEIEDGQETTEAEQVGITNGEESSIGDEVDKSLEEINEEAKLRRELAEEVSDAEKVVKLENLVGLYEESNFSPGDKIKDAYINFSWEDDFADQEIVTNSEVLSPEGVLTLYATNSTGEVISAIIDESGEFEFSTNFNALALIAIQKIVVKPTFSELLAETNFAFTRTNLEKERIEVFLTKFPRQNYVDVEGLSTWQINSLRESGVDIGELDGRNYLISKSASRQKLSIDKRLYKLNSTKNFLILQKYSDADYFVYGTYEHKGRLRIEVNFYLIDVRQKIISHFSNKVIRLGFLNDDLKSEPVKLLAFLQDKNVVKSVVFKGKKEDEALLFLNDRFAGKLPITISNMVDNSYSFRVWARHKELAKVEVKKGGIKSSDKNETELLLNEDDEEVDVSLRPRRKYGTFSFSIDNQQPVDIYMGSLLEASGVTDFKINLPEGVHMLTVRSNEQRPLRIEIPVEAGMESALTIPFYKTKVVPKWRAELFNHSRNAKIFAALGFILGGITMASYMETLDIEDRLNAVDKKISDGVSYAATLAPYRNELNNQYFASRRQSAFLFFLGSLPSFLISTISYSLDVESKRAPVVYWGQDIEGYLWESFSNDKSADVN